MEYKTYRPSGILSENIKYFWSLEDMEGDVPHSRERVFPDGCIELLFHYGDLFRKFHIGGKIDVQPRALIHGQITKFIELEATGKIGIFSVRFTPDGLRPFVTFDIDSITDRVICVSDAWQKDGKLLEKQILEAGNNEERIGIVEKFLQEKWKPTPKTETIVRFCMEQISNSGGSIQMSEMAKKLDISHRQLERMFLSRVGLSLKAYSRIVRFNCALQLIGNKDFSNFTNVAHEGGFYDQAHFIKDFKELTGLNPRQYFSENLEMVKFFNL
jgi:AraC-like DNA-binding protein